jgi:hypothetical protein
MVEAPQNEVSNADHRHRSRQAELGIGRRAGAQAFCRRAGGFAVGDLQRLAQHHRPGTGQLLVAQTAKLVAAVTARGRETKAAELVDCYASIFCLNIGASANFKKEVFKISRGNPKVIKELCRLARDEKYSRKGYVDVKLIDLDRRINSAMIGR